MTSSEAPQFTPLKFFLQTKSTDLDFVLLNFSLGFGLVTYDLDV